MEVAHYVALRAHCNDLSRTFFSAITHAPTVYLMLGRSLDHLSFALERLCMEASHPNSPILEGKARRSTEKVLWLSLYKLSTLLGDVESLLRRLNVTKDKQPQWWLNFANKTRFGHHESFMDLIHRLDFHSYALHMTIRTFNRELLRGKVTAFNLWSTALGMILQHPLQSAPSAPKSAHSSVYSASDFGPDIFQEFMTSSDYYGKDIFEAAKLMVIVRLTTCWTHRGKDGLVGMEQSKALPLAAYGNLLKAGWMLQRLQSDQRSRTEECTAIIVMLTEDVVFELRRINELKLLLPTHELLLQEMDLRIWIDDLEESERNKKGAPRPLEVTGKEKLAEAIRPIVSPGLNREDSGQRRKAAQAASGVATRPMVKIPRRSVGSAPHAKSPSQASASETIMASSDSRATNLTAPSSIETQQATGLSSQSPLSSHSHSNSFSRNPLPKAALPTVAEPTEPAPPVQLSPQKRITVPPDSMQYGVPPLHAYSTENVIRESKAEEEKPLSSKVSTSSLVRKYLEYSVENVSDLQAYDPANPPSQFGDHSRPTNQEDLASPPPHVAEYSRSVSHDLTQFSPTQESRDLDERPGEVEIMKPVFQSMLLFASESFDFRPVWESCSIRIFRKADAGVRLVTYRDSGIDQRFLSLHDTELVPEYGYHKDEPVLFLRRSRSGSALAPGVPRSEDLSAVSLYYRFDNSEDMFNFQMAFTGEAVEIDIRAVRTVRFKRSLLDGEHSNYKARVQLWHEQTFTTVGSGGDPTSPVIGGSISGTIRSRGVAESILKIPSTRLVIYFEETMITMFVTDSVAIEARARTNVIRIKPSSYRTFGNPSAVRARFLGDRNRSGGIQLDKRGMMIDSEDSFDEFKWFEIDFFSEEEMAYFRQDFCNVINERRKERRRVDELRALAANGVRSSR